MTRPKAAAIVGDKNRRALGDIGNVVNHQDVCVVDGKPLPPINRRITRSFGAQLLAKSEAAVSKETVEVHVGGAVKVCDKAGKLKAAVMEKPKEVIVISPDTNEKSNRGSSDSSLRKKKKAHSLTSVLTARSKVACGITDKLKDLVLDIDALDRNDQLAATEYVEGLYKFYKHAESSHRPRDYMASQAEVTAKMRSILADWLLEVHQKFDLMPETLYLTFYIIDCYLSAQPVLRRELQLVGMSAMLIACKYEEIWAPQVNDLITISARVYSREQILVMEKAILNKLEWSLTVPTPYVFLVRFLKAAMGDKEMEHMTFFYSELGLMQYSTVLYRPSLVAAAAVYAARCTLNKSPLWTETLQHHSGFTEAQLLDCARIMINCHSAANETGVKYAHKKYSSAEFGAVALYTPATKLVGELQASSAN